MRDCIWWGGQCGAWPKTSFFVHLRYTGTARAVAHSPSSFKRMLSKRMLRERFPHLSRLGTGGERVSVWIPTNSTKSLMCSEVLDAALRAVHCTWMHGATPSPASSFSQTSPCQEYSVEGGSLNSQHLDTSQVLAAIWARTPTYFSSYTLIIHQ
jgi:hypothetical protein